MSAMSLPSSTPRTSFGRAVLGRLSEAMREFRYRQAGHSLQGMSDAMLHDIGVARSEIEEVVRHGRPARR